jgi:GNAT superfamily N-acetyltransferase
VDKYLCTGHGDKHARRIFFEAFFPAIIFAKTHTMSLKFRQATSADTPLLIENRLDFLREVSGEKPEEAKAAVRNSLEQYFARAIESQTYICWIAEEGSTVAGTGGLVVREQPANFGCPTGKAGYIMNMYTHPEHRKKGICTALLDKLVETAKNKDISILELHATTIGEPLYKKYGFAFPKSNVLEMRL